MTKLKFQLDNMEKAVSAISTSSDEVKTMSEKLKNSISAFSSQKNDLDVAISSTKVTAENINKLKSVMDDFYNQINESISKLNKALKQLEKETEKK